MRVYHLHPFFRGMKKYWIVLRVFCLVTASVFYCQFLIYYVSLLHCRWPDLPSDNATKIMFMSDVHILGDRKGQIFDRLFHEWQMYRSFQTAVRLLDPPFVFILGDIIDEGEWATDEEYERYIQRYKAVFLGDRNAEKMDQLSTGAKLYAIVGNHDIGFHYSLRKFFKQRFERTFSTDSVDLITIDGINFVTINSITMEGDYCTLCADTEEKLKAIGKKLCPSNITSCDRPVLLTHFPLFRKSDEMCDEPDAAPDSIKNDEFKPKWDCLSDRATRLLFDVLNPRLVLTGHTHFGCVTFHKNHVQEWTVASFNWRNIHRPTFLLVTIDKNNYKITKCYLPSEIIVIIIYLITLIFLLIILRKPLIDSFKRKTYTLST